MSKIKILDKQHLNVAEVIQALQALEYPVEKIIAQADHDGFINAEIITADLLRATLNPQYDDVYQMGGVITIAALWWLLVQT